MLAFVLRPPPTRKAVTTAPLPWAPSAGPSEHRQYMGMEGVLGIITEVTFRVQLRPSRPFVASHTGDQLQHLLCEMAAQQPAVLRQDVVLRAEVFRCLLHRGAAVQPDHMLFAIHQNAQVHGAADTSCDTSCAYVISSPRNDHVDHRRRLAEQLTSARTHAYHYPLPSKPDPR